MRKRLYFQAWGVKRLYRFRSDGRHEMLETGEAFDRIFSFIARHVAMVQGFNIQRCLGARCVVERHHPPGVPDLEYFSTPTVAPDSPLYARIQADLADPAAGPQARREIEDVFLHVGGQRVRKPGTRLLVTNPASTRWRQYLADHIVRHLGRNPELAGVFMDDVSVGHPPYLLYNSLPPEVRDSWGRNTADTLAHLRSRVPPDRLIVFNPLQKGHLFPASAALARTLDGVEDEYWIHSYYAPLSKAIEPADWKAGLEALENLSGERIFIAQCGISDDIATLMTSPQQVIRMRRLAMFLYGSFLLGTGPRGLFNFAAVFEGNAGFAFLHFDHYLIDPGQPQGPAEPLTADPPGTAAARSPEVACRRRFERGLVLVNPTSRPIEFSLPPSGCNLQIDAAGLFAAHPPDAPVAGTLEPQTAMIFARVDR